MKAHAQQSVLIFAMALLFAGNLMAQGNREKNDRYNDKRSGNHHYYGGKHHDRDDYRDKDRRDDDYRDRDYRTGNDRNDYPVVRYRPAPPSNSFGGRQPSNYHVWIPGEYRWRNGGYAFHPGSWVVPPRRGVQYVPGYWQPARNGGYVWMSGFWSNGGFSVGR